MYLATCFIAQRGGKEFKGMSLLSGGASRECRRRKAEIATTLSFADTILSPRNLIFAISLPEIEKPKVINANPQSYHCLYLLLLKQLESRTDS
jgi:hypothetical protein